MYLSQSVKNYNRHKLIILGLLIETIYLVFYLIEPARKLIKDGGIVLKNNAIFFIIVNLLILALIFYIFAYKKIADNKDIKIIAVFFIFFSITLLFIWPVGSWDIFSYIYRGRVLSIHHANPFFTAYNSLTTDAFYYFINNKWSIYTTLYGPLFIIISGIITFIGSQSLMITLFLFKFFLVIINIFNFYLIYKIFNSAKALLLYGWNPLILYEFALNGHNDVLILFFILLCLYFLFKKSDKIKNYFISLFFLILSILIKFITIIFLPIFFLIIFFKLKGGRGKLYFAAGAALITIITLFIFYFPFWNGFETLIRPISHSNYIYGTLIFVSPIMLLALSILHNLHQYQYFMTIIKICKAIFILIFATILILIVRNKNKITSDDFIKYSIIALSYFYLFFFTWLMPWYFTILISLLICYSAKINEFKFNKLIYGISLYGILYYLILR